MSEQPTESVFNMSDARLHELHLYKELMSPEERRERYTLLRLSGATASQSRSWRDWSPPHYQNMLDYLNNFCLLAGRAEYIKASALTRGLKSIAVA